MAIPEKVYLSGSIDYLLNVAGSITRVKPDGGQAIITPQLESVTTAADLQVSEVGQTVVDITPTGELRVNGSPTIELIDLSSAALQHRIRPGQATYEVSFIGVTVGGVPRPLRSFLIAPTQAGTDGSGVNQLARLKTMRTAGQVIATGPRGRGFTGLVQTAIDKVRAQLDDGTFGGQEITLPPGAPGGSDPATAQWITQGAQTRPAVDARVKTVAAPVFNVLNYGAVPDGTTTGQGTNNQAAVAAARADAVAAGGGVVLFPRAGTGIYLCGATSLADNVTFRLEPGVTLRRTGASSAVFINYNNVTNAGIEGGTIDDAGVSSSQMIRVSTGTNRWFLRGCTLIDSGPLGQHQSVDVQTGTDLGMVVDCVWRDVTKNNIKLNGAVTRTTILRNRFTGWAERGIWVLGVAGAGTTDLRIEANDLRDMVPGGTARQPISIQGVDSGLHVRLRVLSNTVVGAGVSYDEAGLVGSADLISIHRAVDFVVAFNQVSEGGDVGITIAQQCERGVVYGNVCVRNDTVGMCIGSATSVYTRRLAVTGNTCMNNGQSRQVARPFRSGIQFRFAQMCAVTGNVLGDDQGIAPVTVGDGTATFTAVGNIVTTPQPHGMGSGEVVTFTNITTTTGIEPNVPYHVRTTPSPTTFTLSRNPQDTTLVLTGNGSGSGLQRRRGQHYGITLVDATSIQYVGNTYEGVVVGPTGRTGAVATSGASLNGATPVDKAPAPGVATGTDAAVLNAVVTALRNLGVMA